MYNKFNLKSAEFVISKDEYGFREVLEDFHNAQYINILTFDISKKEDILLNMLRKAGSRNIPITLITNIPQRFSKYYTIKGFDYRRPAQENINIYEAKLNPERMGRLASVFFMFSNHGKIIMTNNIIYWGSSNFSDESKRNYECGVLCRDKEFIKYVNEEVFPDLVNNSTSYYAKEYNVCLARLLSVWTFLHNKFEEIHDASYGIHSDYDTRFIDEEYYDIHNNSITWDMLTDLVDTIEKATEIIQLLQDALEPEVEDEDLQEIQLRYEKYMVEQGKTIKKLCEQLECMVKFDEEAYVNDLLTDKYARYADTEHLDYYAQLAEEKGREAMEEYIESAEPAVEELLETLDEMDKELLGFVDEVMQIASINGEIDNTQE